MLRYTIRILSKPQSYILAVSIASLGIMHLIYPDQYVRNQISFIRFADVNMNYHGVFSILSSFYNGSIVQMWNSYDQMPLAYYYLTGGIYTLSNLFASFAYVILEFMFSSEGEALQKIFSVSFFFGTTILRAAGIYLLLGRFVTNRYTLVLSSIIGTTIFSTQINLGLNPASLFSGYFLIAHFIIKFFEEYEVKTFCIAAVLMAVLVAPDAMIGLGYFYQGIHFTTIAAFLWAAIFNRRGFRRENRKPLITSQNIIYVSISLLVITILLMPYVWILMNSYGDLEFRATESRFNNIFSISEYYSRPIFFAPKGDLVLRWLDYSENQWATSWLFIGAASVFLAILGFIASRNTKKYIFAITLLLVFLINGPREVLEVSGTGAPWYHFSWLAHLLNAITNPFKFILRSFHMTSFLTPFLLLPLVALGIDTLRQSIAGVRVLSHRRVLLLVVALVAVAYVVADRKPLLIYTGLSFGFGMLALWLPRYHLFGSAFATLIVLSLVATDMVLLNRYMKIVGDQNKISEYSLQGIGSLNPVSLEFQNPKVSPFRFHFRNQKVANPPAYLLDDPVNNLGLFYRYQNLEKYFHEPTNYRPCHKSYDIISRDPDIRAYLAIDSRMFFQAEFAIGDEPGRIRDLVNKKLSRKVVVINEPSLMENQLLDVTKTQRGGIPEVSAPSETVELVFQTKEETSYNAESSHGTLRIYQWRLPEDFPSHITSTLYTDDNGIMSAKWMSHTLQPAQGRLVKPFTYDLQNYMNKTLIIALPQGSEIPRHSRVSLRYQARSKGLKVVSNQMDRQVLDFTALSAGWLVAHYPFDKKWKITVNGKPAQVHRANRAFLAFKISKGENKIILEYWPDSIVRELLVLAIVLTVALMLFGFVRIRPHSNA